MIIQNVRVGHANNSSSSHAILLNCSVGHISPNYGDFGWDWFHLIDKDSKKKYLAAQLYQNLKKVIGSENSLHVVKSMFGLSFRDNAPYVDHQSEYSLPLDWKGREIDLEFYKDFSNYIIKSDNVSIRGGNDNNGGDARFDGERYDLPFPKESTRPICRKSGQWWTVFNRETGTKLRISFKENPKEFKLTSPELVDVKITDWCDKRCGFCYQSSCKDADPNGASKRFLEQLAWRLGEAKVFEVAIGGGEPTSHPHFADFVIYLNRQGINPNFTSYDMKWAENKRIREVVAKHGRSFAVSSFKRSDVVDVYQWNREHPGVQGCINIPMGTHSSYETIKQLELCRALGLQITLLGYKGCGRGNSYAEADMDKVLDFLDQKARWHGLGADTIFVEKYRDRLKKFDISDLLIVDREGTTSCYIDAVNETIGAHSYGAKMKDIKKQLFSEFPYIEK
jgi:hypothetical protein